MNNFLLLQLESIIGGITVGWSTSFLTPGESNAGTLTVSPFPTSETFPIAQGSKIGFYNLPADWSISSNEASLWSVSIFPYRGSTITALEYLGTSTVDLSQSLSMAFVVPADATAKISLMMQVFDSTNAPLSTSTYLTLSLVQPSQPLIAYATNQTAVLLSNTTDIAVNNTLLCTLLNRTGNTIATADVTISINGFDANGGAVVIPENILSNVVVTGGGVSWNYNNSQWTATLTNLENGPTLLTFSNLPLTEATLNLLQVEFGMTNISDYPPPYNTSAWFQAYGPYKLSVTLDTDQIAEAQNYALFETTTPGIYTVNSLLTSNTTPPLQPYLVDSAGDLAYPPILGGFSWSSTKINFPSTYSLQSTNYLYYLINNGGADIPLTSIQINWVLLTNASSATQSAPLIFTTQLLDGTYFGMNLTTQNFSGWTNLNYALFQNCNLAGTNFTSANLSSAVLTNATVSAQTNFTSAILANINFNTLGFNLAGVNFSNAILAEANFSGLTLIQTNFTGANFANAYFSNAVLTGNTTLTNLSSFSYAHFDGAHLDNLTIAGNANLDFSYADFTNATFEGTYIYGSTNPNQLVSFSHTILNQANFYNTVVCALNPGNPFPFPDKTSCFLGADFSNAQCNQLTLAPAIYFAACLFSETTITNNVLTSAIFVCTNFPSANFAGTDLTGTCIGVIPDSDRQMMAPLLNRDKLAQIAKTFKPTKKSRWCSRWRYIRAEIYTHVLFRHWKHPHKRKMLRLLCCSFIHSARYLSVSDNPPLAVNVDITNTQFGQATFANMISGNLVGTPASLPPGWQVTGGQFVQS